MRTLLTLALPALLLAAAPAQAQMQSQARDSMSSGSGRTNPSREAEAGDLGPARSLIGKTVVHRYQGGAVGTIRDVVTGDDGRQKLVVALRGSQRQVVLDTAEVDRRGNRIRLMLDPEQVAGLPDYQSQSSMGTMGRTTGGQMGGGMMGATPGGTAQ